MFLSNSHLVPINIVSFNPAFYLCTKTGIFNMFLCVFVLVETDTSPVYCEAKHTNFQFVSAIYYLICKVFLCVDKYPDPIHTLYHLLAVSSISSQFFWRFLFRIIEFSYIPTGFNPFRSNYFEFVNRFRAARDLISWWRVIELVSVRYTVHLSFFSPLNPQQTEKTESYSLNYSILSHLPVILWLSFHNMFLVIFFTFNNVRLVFPFTLRHPLAENISFDFYLPWHKHTRRHGWHTVISVFVVSIWLLSLRYLLRENWT